MHFHARTKHGAWSTQSADTSGDRYRGKQSGCDAESNSVAKSESNSDADPGAESNSRAEPGAESKSDARWYSETDAEPDSKSERESIAHGANAQPDAKSDAKSEPESTPFGIKAGLPATGTRSTKGGALLLNRLCFLCFFVAPLRNFR